MSVNAKQLKKQLTLADYKLIEEKLGLKKYSECSSQTIFYNADAHSNLTEQKPKLYAYRDNNIYLSYTKGCSYDIFGLIQAVKTTNGETCSFVDAVNFVLNLTGYTVDTPTVSNYRYDWSNLERFIKIKKGEAELKIYDDSILDRFSKVYYQGWIDEGITIETMEKYGICWYDRLNQIVIPCKNREGKLIGIRVRNLDPERAEVAKYIPLTLMSGITYKFPTNNVFYGINYAAPIIEQTGHIILTEAEKSALKADSWWGHNSNVVALYGSNLGINRIKQIVKMGVNHVTLALDSDFHKLGDNDYIEFEKKMLKLGQQFKGYCNVDIVYNNIGLENWYKCSPFDGDEETWNKLWESREVII